MLVSGRVRYNENYVVTTAGRVLSSPPKEPHPLEPTFCCSLINNRSLTPPKMIATLHPFAKHQKKISSIPSPEILVWFPRCPLRTTKPFGQHYEFQNSNDSFLFEATSQPSFLGKGRDPSNHLPPGTFNNQPSLKAASEVTLHQQPEKSFPGPQASRLNHSF